MRRCHGLAFLALIVSGCSSEHELMPMKEGRYSMFEVSYGLEKSVAPVRVAGEVPVLGEAGYELKGPMGVSRLVWKNGVLYASETANGRFDPPLPILTEDGKDRHWEGAVEALDTVSPATADLSQKQGEVIGRRTNTTLSHLVLKMPKGTIELDSWFQPRIGLVQQEQRTGGVLVLRMEIVGHPRG